MGATKGLMKKVLFCVMAVLMFAFIFTGCEISEPVTEAGYKLVDNDANYYNQDHTTKDEAVDEFVDSITALRMYLNGESFVDSGYYMGVNYDIDILDTSGHTVGNFALRVQAYLFTFPYEDEEGNPIYKYYENGRYYDENNAAGTRKLVSGLEIHNEAIKKSDIKIEWYNGATNEVLIGLYYDGLNGNVDDPGNILYANIQGYKRSFPDFGDTVLYQQMIRLLVNMSVEGLLKSLGLQADAGTSTINDKMKLLIKKNYKRVVNDPEISLLFDNVSDTSDLVSEALTGLLSDTLGVFGKKWDPMTAKFLGFKFSTVANAVINSTILDMQALISPDKQGLTNVLTDAVFYAHGDLRSDGVDYNYTANIGFDYGWTYPDELMLDKDFYQEFDYGQYDFAGLLYVPAWDSEFDAVIKMKIQEHDNALNNVFIEFRDIANGELMIGVYYRDERAYLDITGMQYMYGWIELEALGFPQVYDERLDLAEVLGKFKRMINRVIVSIVDSILDPAKSDKENNVLFYIMSYTSYTLLNPDDIFSANTETLKVTMDFIKHMLQETGAGTYSTRQIITILDSVMPYSMDQIAIMLGIVSAEVMLDKTYFTLTWDVDTQHFTIIMYTDVGVKPDINGQYNSKKLFQLELDPVYFGDRRVTIAYYDFSRFKPLREIWTYSGLLEGTFIFSSQETVDLSKLLSATIGESSGLNTPYTLATNAGLTFTLDYDQFVSDQNVEITVGGEKYIVKKYQKRSAFKLSVWLTGSESSIILQLMSEDVCFDNEIYKKLPDKEAEEQLGYVWVDIACVTKNGRQVIPKVKIREDVFMASMSAYMHKQTSIEDDVSSFADNDFNLSLTSIISALCKDAYVIPAAEKMEITSSNETLQNLFRVKGLIGNIKVHASFRTDDPETKNRVSVESERSKYYMYQVGYFEDITGNSPYDTPLHDTLPVYFYEDYLPADYPLAEIKETDTGKKEQRKIYDPLKYDFYIFPENVVLEDGSIKTAGTIYIFELGAKRTISRQSLNESYSNSSFFTKEPDENQDINKIKFLYEDFILDPDKEATNANRLVYEIEGKYYYRTYYGVQKLISEEDVEEANDGTIYIYWRALREVVLYKNGTEYYFFDRNKAVEDEDDDGNQAYLSKTTERDLLFEYDEASVEITEACKTQYAPRTNGSFMGEVRRYFITFTSNESGELGKVDTLFYNTSSIYPQYYSVEDEENVFIPYDDEGTQIGDPVKMPIMLYVMEPCLPLSQTVEVYVKTDSSQAQNMKFPARYVIDWELASSDKRGYMVLTDVIVAPDMMGECSFPIRIIVLNREIDTDEYVSVFSSDSSEPDTKVPVIDEIDVDPYEYAMAKYAYLSNTQNLNPAYFHSSEDMEVEYERQVAIFAAQFYAQEKFAFNIDFKWQTSYLFQADIGDIYVQKSYANKHDDVLEKYDWLYDQYTLGTNVETSVSPVGGTIYLHSYYQGQLVALKVNVGKREFSHIKFYNEDDFDPVIENKNNDDNDVYIVGVYRANYYAEETYDISDKPIFVFTDDKGNKFEYVFDMAVVTGLQKNPDGSYSPVYEKIPSYGIAWGDPTITNITSSGSYYEEFTYSYVYSETSFTELNMRYDALGEKQKTVMIMTRDGEIIPALLYERLSDGRAAKRNILNYSELLKVYREDEYTPLYESNLSIAYKESAFDKLYSRNDRTAVYKENVFTVTDPERMYADLTAEEKAMTVLVLTVEDVLTTGALYREGAGGKAEIRNQWLYSDLTTAQKTVTVRVKTTGSSLTSEENLYVLIEGGYAARRNVFAYDDLTEEEKGTKVVRLAGDGSTQHVELYVADGDGTKLRLPWRYSELTAGQKERRITVKTATGYEEANLFDTTESGYVIVRDRLTYDQLTESEKNENVVVLKNDLTRESAALYVKDGSEEEYVNLRNERKISVDLYEDEPDYYVHKEENYTAAYKESTGTGSGVLYENLTAEQKAETVLVVKTDGTTEVMPRYFAQNNGYAAERGRWTYDELTEEMKAVTCVVLRQDGTRNTLPLLVRTTGGYVGVRDKWLYAELGNTYDFKYYKENDTTRESRTYASLSNEEKATRVSVLTDAGTLVTMDYYVSDEGYAAHRNRWTYEELESQHPEVGSGKMISIVKVLYFDNEGEFDNAGFGEIYLADGDGYAMTRKVHMGYQVEYGTGYAPKFQRDRLGYVKVRDEDGVDEMDPVNRPYYYFTLKEKTSVQYSDETDNYIVLFNEEATGIRLSTQQYTTYRSEGFFYPTEEQFNLYASENEEIRKVFLFKTNNNEVLTTAGLDLYHLFRIYYVLDDKMYGRSTLSNNEILPSDLDSQAIDETDFKVIELRVEAECPQLSVVVAGSEKDDLRDGVAFNYNKVDAGGKQMGYYNVDPYRSDTLYLPDSLTIYFNYNGGSSESVHTFTGVEWCADFERDELGNPLFNSPIYTYTNSENDYTFTNSTISPNTLIEKVVENGVTRYKLMIDVKKLDKVITFRVRVKIGNQVSGYQEVTVVVTVLSKDPTNIRFYTGSGENKVLLDTPVTETEFVTGDRRERAKYYSYYVNTFDNFSLPSVLVATFSDGREEEYALTWMSAKTGTNYTFAPNTIVTMYTTIGKDADEEEQAQDDNSLTLDIFLAVMVENYTLNSNNNTAKPGINVNGDLDRYYVTVKTEKGQTYEGKKQLKELFQLSGDEIGYYAAGTPEYYIHISTGSAEDGDTPIGYVGLYTKDDAGNYEWKEAVKVYDLLTALYSKATLNLTKHEMTMDEQEIITENDSVFEHYIQLYNALNPTIKMKLKDVATVNYRYVGGEEIISVDIHYYDEDTGATYTVQFVDDTEDTVLLTTPSERSSRKMKYSELLVYIVNEALSVNYIDNKDGDGKVVGWRVVQVGDYNESTGEWTNVSSSDTADTPFIATSVLSSYVNYRQDDGTVTFSPLLGLTTETGEINEKYIYLQNRYTNKYATLSARELLYRLVHYFNRLRVTDGEGKTVQNKSIAINDLYKIMDINDMLIRDRDVNDPIPQDKYIVSLGTGRGSYDVRAKILFTDGVYLSADSKTTQTITVNVYSANGNAEYAGGYVLGNYIKASVSAVVNVGAGNKATFNYNMSATDDKLLVWHVEHIENAVNPINIVDNNGNLILEGELIERISARSVYATGKNREITISTLTNEGFRLIRTIVFEELTGEMESGFSGGNPNATFAQTKTFVIDDGKITIENVYDYNDPSVVEYFGTSKYLPKTVFVTVNGRRISVSNVEWEISPVWYGRSDSRLSTLDYRGTGGSYLMATAEILGFTDPETKERIGTTTIRTYINITSAEIRSLPWEDGDLGNGLATEALSANAGENSYAVYVDAYSDADALAKKVIASDAYGTYLLLPSDLYVQYTTGKNFVFPNVEYKYSGTFTVRKIYFNEKGIDIAQMVSSVGDLSGVSSVNLNERFIDLTVAIGLGQSLNIRFYFHNKRVGETEYIVYYSEWKDGNGNPVEYMSLTEEQIAETVGSSAKLRYLRNEENGNTLVATLTYYYTTYYTSDGQRVPFSRMTEDPWFLDEAAILDGTEDVPLYVEDEEGFVMMARVGYSDIMPVITMDDETIRSAIRAEKIGSWELYEDELTASTNNIRIQYNLENIISQAQEMRSVIKEVIDETRITDLDSLTVNGVRATLESWIDSLTIPDGFNESELPKRSPYSEEECYKYAAVRYGEQYSLAYSYAESIVKIAQGSGSRTSKNKAITEKIGEYYDELIRTVFTQIIRDYMETEFENLFMGELDGMSDDEFNDSVLYKNLVEGKFDADKAVEVLYKLRSLNQHGVPAELAALQIEAYAKEAFDMGYGYDLVYADYRPNGSTITYSELTGTQQLERVGFAGFYNYGGDLTVKKYEQGSSGQAQVLTRQYDYDKLVEAVFVQTLYNAYRKAYNEAYKGALSSKIDLKFKLAPEDYYNNDGMCMHLIAYRTNKILEHRLNLGAHCAISDPFTKATNETYTIDYFVQNYAYDTTSSYVNKKTMRSYLINILNEGMDFTASKGTEGDDSWDDFLGLKMYIINNAFLSIANYASSINSIRRSLLSSTSITGTLKRLIELSVASFAETVYAEKEYAETIKNIQILNGQIIPADKVMVDDGITTTFSREKFAEAIEKNTALYFIEPYYSYRAMPHKILVYFDGEYVLDQGRTTERVVTDKTEDVSGRPYMTTIEWTGTTFRGGIDYLGGSGSLTGTISSPVVTKTETVRMSVVAENKEKDVLYVTTKYMDEGLEYALTMTDTSKRTSDNRYYMLPRSIVNSSTSVTTDYIYFYEFKDGWGSSEYTANGRLVYTLAYRTQTNGEYTNTFTFAGYDSSATVVYEFSNIYRLPGSRTIEKQYLYVYNPFVFSQQKDMPSQVKIDGEYMSVLWNAIGIDPRGNIASTGEQKLAGKVGNVVGQSITMSVSIARWSYAGFYRKTEAEGNNGITHSVEGEEERFVYMNSNGLLEFYFSAYLNHSPQDYYLIAFAVHIYKDGATKRITFDTIPDAGFRTAVEREEGEGGFVREIFYPEDSRLVEYGTDDDTMERVNERKRYLIYWEDNKKNGVINAYINGTGGTQSEGIVSLGNETMGEYELGSIRQNGDTVAPIRAKYTCERMNVARAQFVTPKATDSEATSALYAQIESVLYARSGQIPVVITPDGYLPTTGYIGLSETNVHYDPSTLRVRYLWNSSFTAVTNALIPFIAYAYPDVEDSARRNFARNIIMTWDIISETERQELISLAKDYERNVVNADRSATYTNAEAQRDAYALLAINERYNYSGTDANKLRGGGNNNVLATVLVGVEGSTEVLETRVTVKALFQDYTPLEYFERPSEGVYNPIVTMVGRREDLMKTSTLYIAVRKNYWISAQNKMAYEDNSPYDNIGDDMYKLLQIEANRNATATDGTARDVRNDRYLIRIDNIIWEYRSTGETTGRLVSKSFSIAGVTYTSDLLQVAVSLTTD